MTPHVAKSYFETYKSYGHMQQDIKIWNNWDNKFIRNMDQQKLS